MAWETWEPLTTEGGAQTLAGPAARPPDAQDARGRRWQGAGSLLEGRRRNGVRGQPLLELVVTAACVEATPVFFYTSGHMEHYERDPSTRVARGDEAGWRALQALVAPGLLAQARALQEAMREA